MFELKRDKKIFIVTNRHLIEKGNIYDVIEKCALKGADGVILREKDLSYDSLKKMAEGIKNITDKYNIPLIINGNIDVAKNVNAYGFHTGVDEFRRMSPMSQVISNHEEKEGLGCTFATFRAREYDSQKLVLGVSVHSSDEAIEAEKLGANYIIAGHIFETECKPGLKARGIEFIQKVCKSVRIPVIAIGGITPNNLNEVLNTEVFGVAVMSYGMKI
jgi:Thiamine monophosphate synthase